MKEQKETRRSFTQLLGFGVLLLLAWGCHQNSPDLPQAKATPNAKDVASQGQAILLITLDTTRADRLGFEGGPPTPALDRLAEKSQIYRRAYTTAPTTLPSHVSIMTGRYPFQHGIHENARYLDANIPTLAEKLTKAQYETAAFVSGYPLAATFGLARGFATYDEPETGRSERSAEATTEKALTHLRSSNAKKLFMWVHYYDPHAPYQPPPTYAERFPGDAYQGEIAFMDDQIGRLLAEFATRFGDSPHQIIVVADHGEGLGEGGEVQHGHLLTTGVMRVPMLVAGSTIEPGEEHGVFSTRRIFGLIQSFAGLEDKELLQPEVVVLGEAMKPFLQYGWAPQTLAVTESNYVIRSGNLQLYNALNDPLLKENLFGKEAVPPKVLEALKAYALPASLGEAVELSEADRARLASLGYSASQGMSVLRDNLPEPASMVHLLERLDRASHAFANGNYPSAIEEFTYLTEQDPNNLMVHLRLAVSQSLQGRRDIAETHFAKAGALSPGSVDVRHYLGMHYLRFGALDQATQAFSWVLDQQPNRLTALKVLANLLERQGQVEQAASLWERAAAVGGEAKAHVRAALLFMQMRQSAAADRHFQAAAQSSTDFQHQLEWGVCLLDLKRLDAAATQLEAVAPNHPGYGMALFKRAQVSALRGQGDVRQWIEKALQTGQPQVRQLIQNDGLLRPHL